MADPNKIPFNSLTCKVPFWFRSRINNQDDLEEKEITEIFSAAFNSQIRGKTEYNINDLLIFSLYFYLTPDCYCRLIIARVLIYLVIFSFNLLFNLNALIIWTNFKQTQQPLSTK